MNYELAKKLKDAGFLLIEVQGQMFYEVNGKKSCPDCGYPFWEVDGKVYLRPVLDVLIEACGDRFEVLRQYKQDITKKVIWFAGSYDKDESGNRLETTSESPEEAVAKLWLALNSKNETRPS